MDNPANRAPGCHLTPEDVMYLSKGNRRPEWMLREVIHSPVTGLSPQVSGSGVRHQVQVRARTRT
jgi:hypothetical protein